MKKKINKGKLRLLTTDKHLHKFGDFLDKDGNTQNAFSKANAFGTAAGIAQAASGLIGNALSGGHSSGVGNAMLGLSGVASAIPGPWGAAVSAGLNIVGGAINGMFGGPTIDEEKKQANAEGNSELMATAGTVSSFDDIQGVADVKNELDIAENSWFGGGASEINEEERQKREYAEGWANRLVDNLVSELNKRISNSMESLWYKDGGGIHIKPSHKGRFTAYLNRTGKTLQEALHSSNPHVRQMANFARNAKKWHHAFGGDLSTNGADFTNGLTWFDNGGSHEENPYEGVQQGIAPDGQPNLVEQGEVKYDDYIFSDRLTVPKDMLKKYHLKKNTTYADAVKKVSKESAERPNDPISQAGLKSTLNELTDSLEEVRMNKQAKEIKLQINKMTPEELMALQEQMNQQAYACGGHLHKDGDYNYTWKELNHISSVSPLIFLDTYDGGADLFGYPDAVIPGSTPEEKQSNFAKYYVQHIQGPQNPLPIQELKVSNPYLTNFNGLTLKDSWSKPVRDLAELEYGKDYGYIPEQENLNQLIVVPLAIDESKVTKTPSKVKSAFNAKGYAGTGVKTSKKSDQKESYKPTSTIGRYAPLVSNSLGMLFNKKDYTNPNIIQNAANAARQYKSVSVSPVGTELHLQKYDPNRVINTLNANTAAANRLMSNLSGGNRGTAMAGILANTYNNQLAQSAAYQQALELNNAIDQALANFYLNRNVGNATRALQAAEANQQADSNALNRYLTGTTHAAELRQKIADTYDAAQSKMLSNIANSLSGTGSENLAYNMANSNKALDYWTDPVTGISSYKGKKITKAKGGMLTKRSRRK